MEDFTATSKILSFIHFQKTLRSRKQDKDKQGVRNWSKVLEIKKSTINCLR
jgi:hypothetical protein